MTIRTAGNRILVKPHEIKKKTASGLIIEYAENEKLEKGAREMGIVVEIGESCWFDFPGWPNKPWCKVGDEVIYAKYAGKNVKDPYTGEEFVMLNDVDVVGVSYDPNNVEA